jgi:hypothetical protein
MSDAQNPFRPGFRTAIAAFATASSSGFAAYKKRHSLRALFFFPAR